MAAFRYITEAIVRGHIWVPPTKQLPPSLSPYYARQVSPISPPFGRYRLLTKVKKWSAIVWIGINSLWSGNQSYMWGSLVTTTCSYAKISVFIVGLDPLYSHCEFDFFAYFYPCSWHAFSFCGCSSSLRLMHYASNRVNCYCIVHSVAIWGNKRYCRSRGTA